MIELLNPDTSTFNEDSRSISEDWVLGTLPDEAGPGHVNNRIIARLYITHYSSGKYLSASLDRVGKGDLLRDGVNIGGVERRTISLTSAGACDSVRLLSEPISRYSKKRLEEFAERARAALAENMENPKVQEVLRGVDVTDERDAW